jgi:transcription elongation factor Elf1
MARREASCPLCGAKMVAAQVLDACEEIVDEAMGVLACHCPYCQGYFEVRPTAGLVEIGYLRYGHFDAVVRLPADGLNVLRDTTRGALRIRMAWQDWRFSG